MTKLKTSFPLAFFITFTCYGARLHGNKNTSVDRHHNIPETKFLLFNAAREISAVKRMRETPYYLDLTRRNIALHAIKDVCIYRDWVLFAAHVRTNHVHLVIHAKEAPNIIMNTIKAYASRYLNKLETDNGRSKRWTRHGSTRYLRSERDIETTIQYVVYGQGEAMAVFENEDRSFHLVQRTLPDGRG